MAWVWGTKAETLEHLEGKLASAQVLPQVRFTVEDWRAKRDHIWERIVEQGWDNKQLIVRSSCLHEDAAEGSLAGRYRSRAKVSGWDEVAEAIDDVAASFGPYAQGDQIFIQPMLINAVLSGVAFTMDPSTGSPYFLINYDRKSGATDTVTGGGSINLETFFYFKSRPTTVAPPLDKIISLLWEMERLLGSEWLDVEFAIAVDEALYLFQVRPLVKTVDREPDRSGLSKALEEISYKLSQITQPHPYLHGRSTVLGVMPDWNPAEIIGIRPRPLALSLYRELVTDGIWAYQRHNYGYRDLRSFPLLISLGGQPYIDTRVSFNSFIPRDIEEDLAEKLANHYIEKLRLTPSHHDKVEFKIIFTCYTFDLPRRIQVLSEAGFTAQDCRCLIESLRLLTNRIIHGQNGLWRMDIEKIYTLEGRLAEIVGAGMDKVSTIYWLKEDCKRYGTLPFAGLARAGFIAVQMLRSLVREGAISENDYQRFNASLETVSSQMSSDFHFQPTDRFLERYGHLRPGTYDILSPRYDEEPERYFDWSQRNGEGAGKSKDFQLSLRQFRQIEGLLKEHGIEHDALGLLEFIKEAIENREYAKFVFTRHLSEILRIFKDFGRECRLDAEDCSYADISIISQLYGSSQDVRKTLRESIASGREDHQLTKDIVLPPLLSDPKEVWAFHMPEAQPNYVTMGRVVANVVFADQQRSEINGGVVMIPSADPGYDWIFSHGPAGLITKYGGINSHMAIRAGEMGIPSVIGAGEVFYSRWSQGRCLEIDCPNRRVSIIQ